ncbi:hypothetical protein AKG34_20615 [Peribacillus butanolivorans]|uniref:YdbC family protein n=1 Tax=Peribacillus butanolivorans TaxID=421767 RepID=UPI0006A6AB1D|nr:YdbC family protein [Peribacillus butanolivorans]KON70938.1 hypothetical protein AKG34_20615 [Peribacillus butanolivorans]
MLIKWIKCQVNEKNKSSFSNAQEGWGELKQVDGFIGQIGGWDKNNPFEAGIISFWRDDRSYQAFMEQQHDEIFEKSNQRNTYSNISVHIYEKMFNISTTDMTDFLSKGSLLRVADCFVETNKQLEFKHMQKEVWNKGMKASPGMLAGVFAEKKNGRYLVASLWENDRSHQWYVDNKLPALIQSSGVKDPAIRITGSLIKVNPKWIVF